MPENVNFNLLIVCSMSCNITVSVSDDFAKEAKRLAKEDASTVKTNVVKQMVRDMEFEI